MALTLCALGLGLLISSPVLAANVLRDSDMSAAGITDWQHVDLLLTNTSQKASDFFNSAPQSLRGTSATGNRADVEWYNEQLGIGTINASDTVNLSLWWGALYNISTQSARGDLFVEIKLSGDTWNNAIELWTLQLIPSNTFQSATVGPLPVGGLITTSGTYDLRLRFVGKTGRDNAANIQIWWDDVVLDVVGGNTPPVANDDAFATDEDTQLNQAAPGVLANDTDAEDGIPPTAVLQNDVTNGTLVLNADGSFTYDPNPNFFGTDTFTYFAQDSQGVSSAAPATVTLTVNSVNDLPVANDDSFSTPQNTQLSQAAPGVLANDTDVEDGTPPTAVLQNDVTSGTLVLNADGSFTYDPNPGFTGTDTFTYFAQDSQAANSAAPATVTITVTGGANTPPVANDDAFATGEDTQLNQAAPGVLANDTDAEDGTPPTAVLQNDVANGTLVLNADGSFTYDPNPNFAGTDTFTYFARDSQGADSASPATVTLTVNPINDAPVANDDSFSTPQDTQLSQPAPGVLANDTDVEDGTPTAAVLQNDVASGTLVLNSDGSFTYDPNPGFTGSDSFTYFAQDSQATSSAAAATVTLNVLPPVNNPPVVTITSPGDGSSFNEGDTIDFIGSASDPQDGDLTAGLSWISDIDGALGTGGTFSRSDLSVGTHTVTASVTDAGGLTGQDQITVTVNAVADNATTVTGSTGRASSCQQITVTSVFAGDADDDGSTLVEYKLTADSIWTPSCAQLTGPSPRQCLIPGLAPGSYDVRVTFSDSSDGVSGPVMQTIGPFTMTACGSDDAAPTVLFLAPRRDAVLGALERVKVQIFDASPLAATPVQVLVDGAPLATTVSINPNYQCPGDTSGCAIYEFDLDTTAFADGSHRLTLEVTDEAGNVAEVGRAFRVNNNLGGQARGGGLLLRRTHGSGICMDCHNIPTHSSRNTDTGYGNWAMECMDCHTPHGTTNLFLIRKEIRTPASGRRSVRFENRIGAVASSTGAGNASFANEDNATQADGPCQVCHTRTHNQGTGAPRWRNASAGGNTDTHNTSAAPQRCTLCHTHSGGFRGAGGDCLGCHGNAGGPGTQGPNGRRPVLPDFENFTGGGAPRSHHVGNGGPTMGGQLTAFDCVVCHAEGWVDTSGATPAVRTVPATHGGNGGTTSIELKHTDDWVNTDTPAASTFFSYDKAAITGTAVNWNSGNATWVTQTTTALDPFCLTCHDTDGAAGSFNAQDGGNALNPFGDASITNENDQQPRGRVVDIRSKVDAFTANLDRDLDTEPRGKDGIADPPEGIYSRHAIRNQAFSIYTGQQIPNAFWNQSQVTWNDASVMGCADCHTVDGAHGSGGNAHGSPSEYLLKDNNDADGVSEGRVDLSTGTFTAVCYRCHDFNRYSRGLTVDHTDNDGEWVDTVDQVGTARRSGDGNILGLVCFNCHGGFGFGAIHGTSDQFGTGAGGGGTPRQAYRFMNGANLRYYDPNGWTGTTSSCWTLTRTDTNTDSWGSCSQHGSGSRTLTRRNVRDLTY